MIDPGPVALLALRQAPMSHALSASAALHVFAFLVIASHALLRPTPPSAPAGVVTLQLDASIAAWRPAEDSLPQPITPPTTTPPEATLAASNLTPPPLDALADIAPTTDRAGADTPPPPPEPSPAQRLLETLADELPVIDEQASTQSIQTPVVEAPVDVGRRYVFVLDAAGSTAPVFAAMATYVTGALDTLDERDQFAIILARTGANAPSAFGDARLIAASPAARRAAAQWLDAVRPFGAAKPLAGLEPALRLKPDAIVYVARAIPRTPDAGAFRSPRPGLDHHELLARLDRLNPRNPRTGARQTAIHAVQLAEDDPTGLMQAIAHDHGVGDQSYRVLRLDTGGPTPPR